MLLLWLQIQLTQEQIQALTAQMQGKQPGQPIMIQTAQPQLDQQQAEQMTQVDSQSHKSSLVWNLECPGFVKDNTVTNGAFEAPKCSQKC